MNKARRGKNQRKQSRRPASERPIRTQSRGKSQAEAKQSIIKRAWHRVKFNPVSNRIRKRRARRRIELRNHPERDSTKHYATIVAVVAMVATTVTTIYVTGEQAETTRENSRVQAELFDQNQTRSFLRTQRQSVYAEFYASTLDLALETSEYMIQYPRLLDAGLVDPEPYEKLTRTRFDYFEITTEAQILASPKMYGYITDASKNMRDLINETERVMRAYKDNPNGPTIPEMMKEVEARGISVSTRYGEGDFLRIAREDLGNEGGF